MVRIINLIGIGFSLKTGCQYHALIINGWIVNLENWFGPTSWIFQDTIDITKLFSEGLIHQPAVQVEQFGSKMNFKWYSWIHFLYRYLTVAFVFVETWSFYFPKMLYQSLTSAWLVCHIISFQSAVGRWPRLVP